MLPPESRIRFRLTAAQLHAIRLGFALIVKEHGFWTTKGVAYSYPQHLQHPKRGDAKYNAQLMAEIVQANAAVANASGKTCRVAWNTIQIRAGVLAARVQADNLRFQRRKWYSQEKKKRTGTVAVASKLPFVSGADINFAQRAATKLSQSLDKQLKRANRLLIKHAGRESYERLNRLWRQHLLWMRLHLVYFRPFPVPAHPGRTQRLVVKQVANNMEVGLKQMERVPPAPDGLNRLARAVLRDARRHRIGWSVTELKEPTAAAQRFLAEYAIARCHLKRSYASTEEKCVCSHAETNVAPDDSTTLDDLKPAPIRSASQPNKRSKVRPLAPHRKQQRLTLSDPSNRSRLSSLRRNWKHLDLIEQATEITSLLQIGCTQRGLAAELRVSPTTIGQRVKIARLPEEHRIAIKAGASANELLGQIRLSKIEAQLASRFSRPAYRAQRARELQDFLVDTIENSKISFRMYKAIKSPILEAVRMEAQRLGERRLPKPANAFSKVLALSEPPIKENDRRELARVQNWIGVALARIEPDQALLIEAITASFALLTDESRKIESSARLNEQLRVLDQLNTAPRKKTSLRGTAPDVPTRSQLNHPF